MHAPATKLVNVVPKSCAPATFSVAGPVAIAHKRMQNDSPRLQIKTQSCELPRLVGGS